MITNAINAAQAGLQAVGMRLAASAHNTANLNTEGAGRLRTTAISTPQGVRTETTSTPTSPAVVEEVMSQRTAAIAYTANLTVTKVADEMLGELLDVLG